MSANALKGEQPAVYRREHETGTRQKREMEKAGGGQARPGVRDVVVRHALAPMPARRVWRRGAARNRACRAQLRRRWMRLCPVAAAVCNETVARERCPSTQAREARGAAMAPRSPSRR